VRPFRRKAIDKALKALEESLELGFAETKANADNLAVDADLNAIRDDPRFKELTSKYLKSNTPTQAEPPRAPSRRRSRNHRSDRALLGSAFITTEWSEMVGRSPGDAGNGIFFGVMSQLSLFDPDDVLPPRAARLAPKLRALAEHGVYFGTSSWKYPGWLADLLAGGVSGTGQVLAKPSSIGTAYGYAAIFPVVGGDFRLLSVSVTDYWKRRSTELHRYDSRSRSRGDHGSPMAQARSLRQASRTRQRSILERSHVRATFRQTLEPYAGRVAALIFEFGTFSKATFSDPGPSPTGSRHSWKAYPAAFGTRLRFATPNTSSQITLMC